MDKQRLLFFERRAIVLWHHIYQLRQQKLLPDANWNEQSWVIQNIGRRRPIRESWAAFKGGFEFPFQEYVECQFAIADEDDKNHHS